MKEFEERLAALKEVVPEYDITDKEARRLVLDELVNQQMLVLGAEKTGLARQSDIRAAVDEFRRTLICGPTKSSICLVASNRLNPQLLSCSFDHLAAWIAIHS